MQTYIQTFYIQVGTTTETVGKKYIDENPDFFKIKKDNCVTLYSLSGDIIKLPFALVDHGPLIYYRFEPRDKIFNE